MIPNALIDFLQQLSVGQLEVIYENLTCNKECVAVPSPPALMTSDYLILMLCTFPYLDLLDELLKYETADGITLNSELGTLYERCICLESEEQVLREMLRKHHCFAHRMHLFEQYAKTIDWMEEPFERLVGVLSKTNVGFVIKLEQPAATEAPTIVVRASNQLATQWIYLFANIAYAKYPLHFKQEYGQYSYQTGHYEHPLEVILSPHTPKSLTLLSLWNEAIDNICSMNPDDRLRGQSQFCELLKRSETMRASMRKWIPTHNNAMTEYPLELELCSANSLSSMLWLYAYGNLQPPTVDSHPQHTVSQSEYTRVVKPIRDLFAPLWTVIRSFEDKSQFENSELLSEE